MRSKTTLRQRARRTPWEWIRRYRIWLANRKVFLYPENYVEPEPPHDDTALSKETASTLRNSEATDPERERQ